MIKFEDEQKHNGFGPDIRSVEVLNDTKSTLKIEAGTDSEKPFMYRDSGSNTLFKGMRFADGNGYWIYKIKLDKPGKTCILKIDARGQYFITVTGFKETVTNENNQTLVCDGIQVTLPPEFSVPYDYQLVSYEPQTGQPIYSATIPAGKKPIVFDQKIGSGNFLFCGIPAKFMTKTVQGPDVMRSLVKYVCDKTPGMAYKESGWIKFKRGKYMIAHAIDKSCLISGTYIDTLDSNLKPVTDLILSPSQNAILCELPQGTGSTPKIVFTTYRLISKQETDTETSFTVNGPDGTMGAARIFSPNLVPADVRAGKFQDWSWDEKSHTMLIKFANSVEGTAVKIKWK
jgi:hypothetical protein